jgi:hypothetical protein
LSEVLTAPVLMAAALVCVAAVAKLREPAGAVRALVALGLPARASLSRALGAVELAAGIAVLVAPGRATVAVLGALYVAFAGAGAALLGRGVGCGCFGFGGDAPEQPVSVAHVLLSGALALVCAAGVLWPPHGLTWAVARPVLAIGVAGCTYAALLAYTQLPTAWGAWRTR